VRESAITIAGYFGYAECLDRVLAHCQDDEEVVRRTAVEQLAFFEGLARLRAPRTGLAADTAVGPGRGRGRPWRASSIRGAPTRWSARCTTATRGSAS
jgi:hypothetical protein